MKSIAATGLAACLLLGLPASSTTQEPAKDKAAKERKQVMEVLKSFVGTWEGTCQTWFEPGKMADESQVKGEFKALMDERFFRHTYEGTIKGKPRHGEETFAVNPVTKRFQASWIDDFHTNRSILFSEGETSPRGFTVSCKWDVAPDTPQWGWKTVYELIDNDHLTITAYCIKPDGQESKGVETKYVRKK